MAVGQHGMRLRVEEVAVPDAQQAQQQRRVGLERRSAEVLVDEVEAGEHLAEAVRRRWRPSGRARWPSRRSSARRPSPRTRTCCPCRCRTPRPSRRSSTPPRSAWRPRSRRRPSPSSSQSRAAVALVMVSIVVKVFEATTNSVSAGSRSRTASCRSAPSTLETKRKSMSRCVYGRSASYAIFGPRSEPPMPMLTTVLIRLPVWPRPVAVAHLGREERHPGEHRVHLAARRSRRRLVTAAETGVRSAVCRTARSSVTLIFSPSNMASRSRATPVAAANSPQQPQRVVGDQVLGEVQVQVAHLEVRTARRAARPWRRGRADVSRRTPHGAWPARAIRAADRAGCGLLRSSADLHRSLGSGA